MLPRSLPIAALVALTGACGSNPRPRIREVETITNAVGTAQTILRSEMGYAGGRLAEITTTRDGQVVSRMTLTYSAGEPDVIDTTGPAGETITRWDLDFTDGRISRFVQDRPVVVGSTPEVISSVARRTEHLTWGVDGDRTKLSYVHVTSTTPIAPEVETVGHWYERYRYDGEGRLLRITTENPERPGMTELRYDTESGDLEQVETQLNGGAPGVVSFSWDSERVERATEGTDRYDIEYKDDRVHEIIFRRGTATSTTRYVYGDGDLEGLMPAPEIPFGYLFGMDGKLHDAPEYANLGRLR